MPWMALNHLRNSSRKAGYEYGTSRNIYALDDVRSARLRRSCGVGAMSTNALAVVHPQFEDPKLLETIKQTVCKGATDAQLRMFIEVCKSTGLNPFLKEVYYVADK